MVFYQYRGKGGKQGQRELPRPAYEAIVRALAAFGLDVGSMAPEESLWPAVGAPSGITSGTPRRAHLCDDVPSPASTAKVRPQCVRCGKPFVGAITGRGMGTI